MASRVALNIKYSSLLRSAIDAVLLRDTTDYVPDPCPLHTSDLQKSCFDLASLSILNIKYSSLL